MTSAVMSRRKVRERPKNKFMKVDHLDEEEDERISLSDSFQELFYLNMLGLKVRKVFSKRLSFELPIVS